MAYYVPEILLWLFVIDLGIAFGAGLYEQRIVLPLWFDRSSPGTIRVNREAMRSIDTGRKFWGFVTTVPLTLLTLVNLPLAWNSVWARREWWLAAALVTLLERIGTFSYFIPTAIKLMRVDTAPPEKLGAMASQWIALNRVRGALALAGWLAALKALSLPG